FAALLNQAQGSNLGNFNALVYPLGNTPAFHTAASMGSDFAHVGLGSPNLNLLHLALLNATPGPVNGGTSSVEAIPSSVLADGTSLAGIVVRVRDANGNIVSGANVSLQPMSGSSIISAPSGLSSLSNGSVLFTVKDSVAQSVTYTAHANGVPLLQTVTV